MTSTATSTSLGSVANKTTLGEETYNLQAVKGIVTGISANGKAIVDGVATELTAAPDQVGANVVYYKNSSTGKLTLLHPVQRQDHHSGHQH